MQPELVRAARHGVQLQKRRFFRPLQHAVLRQRPLPPLVDHADEAAAADLIDRQVDLPLISRRLTENGGKIRLFQLPLAQHPAEPVVDIRVFRQNHHAERVPVEPRHGMDAGGLAALQQMIQNTVCQRPAVFLRRRMHQHAGRLVDRQKAFVLIEHGKRHRLRIKALRPLLEHDAHPVAGIDARVGMGRRVVYKQRVLPFEPLDQPGGQPEFPPQKRQQLRLPRGCLFQNHARRLLWRYYTVTRRGAQAPAIPPAAGRNGPRAA